MKKSVKKALLENERLWEIVSYFVMYAVSSIIFGSAVIGILYCHNKAWPHITTMVLIYILYTVLPLVIAIFIFPAQFMDLCIKITMTLCYISVVIIFLKFPFSIVLTLV